MPAVGPTLSGDGRHLAVSALDPLNLVGTIVAGTKVPRQLGARVLWRDGLPVATLAAGAVTWLVDDLSLDEQRAAHRSLLREPESSPLVAWGLRRTSRSRAPP